MLLLEELLSEKVIGSKILFQKGRGKRGRKFGRVVSVKSIPQDIVNDYDAEIRIIVKKRNKTYDVGIYNIIKVF